MKRAPAGVLSLIVLWILGAPTAHAQIAQDQRAPGSFAPGIEGYVMNEAGLPVPGARVVLSGLSSPFGQTGTTDGGGRFGFHELNQGRYKISVSAPGYATVEQAVDLLQVTEILRLVLPGGPPPGPDISDAAFKAYEAGLEALNRGRFERAAEHLEQAVREAPDYAPAWTNLGVVYVQLRASKKARRAFEAALDRNRDSAGAHLGLGLLANDDKRFDDAENHLLAARELNELDWHVHYELGRTYYGLDRLAEAETSLRTAVADEPPFGKVYLLLGNTFVLQEKYAEGLVAMEQFLEVAPDSDLAPRVREKVTLLRAEVGRIAPGVLE